MISARAGGWFVDRVTVPASSMLVTVCAGEPATRVSWTMLVSVYPRACGGTHLPSGGHRRHNGLSPRGRGNQYHTEVGDLCYEPFLGSGTQLIAAEKLGRVCYALEREPQYVDVAVKRWESFTGDRARRDDQ